MKKKQTLNCDNCGTPTTEPRRGLCQRCYLVQYRGQHKSENCECCGWSDPRVLVRRRDLDNSWLTLCANCAQIRGKKKLSLSQLKIEVFPNGDRRSGDRRSGMRRRKTEKRTGDDRRILLRDKPDQRLKDRRKESTKKIDDLNTIEDKESQE